MVFHMDLSDDEVLLLADALSLSAAIVLADESASSSTVAQLYMRLMQPGMGTVMKILQVKIFECLSTIPNLHVTNINAPGGRGAEYN